MLDRSQNNGGEDKGLVVSAAIIAISGEEPAEVRHRDQTRVSTLLHNFQSHTVESQSRATDQRDTALSSTVGMFARTNVVARASR